MDLLFDVEDEVGRGGKAGELGLELDDDEDATAAAVATAGLDWLVEGALDGVIVGEAAEGAWNGRARGLGR